MTTRSSSPRQPPTTKDNVYSTPSRSPTCMERTFQEIQLRGLQKPCSLTALTLLPIVSFIEQANPLLVRKREAFGPNFCNSGTVVLSEWEEVERILTSAPQARTFRLGTGFLDGGRLPMMVQKRGCLGFSGCGSKPRNLFLLSLSQEGAGGSGMQEAVQGVFIKYLIAPAVGRQKDATAKALVAQLVEDYKSMDHGLHGAFFNDAKKGMLPFIIKYVHYCLYGIDPSDKKTFDTLYNFYFGNVAKKGAVYYLSIIGNIFNCVNTCKFTRLLPKVVQIYENSPAIASMPDNVTSFELTKNEVANMTVPIMAIASTLGPRDMIQYAMGAELLPNHGAAGVTTDQIDVCEKWDSINLDDRDEVIRYIYEVNRLRPPVGHTHHVAEEDFTVEIMGKERTFPKGSVILIPISLTMLDKNTWGENTHEFDHGRLNLVEKSMIFHSVGDKTNGRICPGRAFGLNMAVELITECGKARRHG